MTGRVDEDVQGKTPSRMARASKGCAGFACMKLEEDGIDLPQLAVEAVSRPIGDLPIQVVPDCFDQARRPAEGLADPLAIRERRDGRIDVLLRLSESLGRSPVQPRRGSKRRKAGGQVIADVALRSRRATGPKLQVKAPLIDGIVTPDAHALGRMRSPGPFPNLPVG